MAETEPRVPSRPKERVATYLYFSSLYFITLGTLYLWGYWSTFNVNILEYLSLADVVKATAYPIASAAIFLLLGVASGAVLATADPRLFPTGGGRDSNVGKFLFKYSRLAAPLYVSGLVLVIQFGPDVKWQALPLLIALPAYAFAIVKGFLIDVIPHTVVRLVVLLLIPLLPPLAFGHGKVQSGAIAKGSKYEFVASTIEGVNIAHDAKPAQRLRYLGHAGDFLFFIDPRSKAVVITRFDSTKSLVLVPFPSAATDAAPAAPASSAAASAASSSPVASAPKP